MALAYALVAHPVGAQTADEHASHHPGAGAAGASSSPAMAGDAPMAAPAAAAAMAPNAPIGAAGAPPSGGGGMMEMMNKMMAPAVPGATVPATGAMGGCMGGGCGSGAAKTPIYPSLMTLPALTPEKRAEIEALANVQLEQGMRQLTAGAEALEHAAQASDYLAMQQSVGLMHEGLNALGAGIAARRVLAEGKAPRNLALDWFKREMNLASPLAPDVPSARPGIASFHLFAMALLVVFAVAMVAMYFFKMRRTAALFKRIEPDPDGPPRGGSPPLGGVPGSPAPKESPVAGAIAPVAPTSSTAPLASGPSPEASSAASVSQAPSAPVTANWRGQLRVGSIVTETPDVKTFRLLSTTDDRRLPFAFMPGQFLNTTFGIGGARMNRSYSISSSPTQHEYAELTVRREPRGAVSRHIVDLLKVGDHVEVGGPVGKFTFDGSEADSIVLIAGGVGITPMMSVARYLTEQVWAGDIFLIYACRTPADFIFANELAALQQVNPKLHVTVTMSRPDGTDWQGPRGRLTKELLTQSVPDLAARRVHLCGPPLMMEATKALLAALGVASEQLKTEAFGTPKPAPGTAGTTAKPTVAASGPLVTFSKYNKSAKIHDGQTILELSEELAIGIEFSCRVGTCGICKVKMTSGEVEMAVEDALSSDDKTNGIILACQAKPKAAVTVEA